MEGVSAGALTGRIYIRGERHLFAIARPGAEGDGRSKREVFDNFHHGNIKAVALAVVLICACVACSSSTKGIQTQFVGSYPFSATERRTIARIAGLAAIDARRHLPALASQITLRVQSGKDVIPELGATAAAVSPDWVSWTVDPDSPQGVVRIAETHLRGALFHEFHHLVRGSAITSQTLMDHVVSEGLATAFERDFAGVSPLWAEYPNDVSNWVDELAQQPPTANRADWLSQHPDGRRWIGLKAGAYLVDLAMKRLNRSSATLVSTPTDDILAAAQAEKGFAPANPGRRPALRD